MGALPNDGYMTLAVEPADRPGQRLEAYFNYHDRYEPDGRGGAKVVGQRRSVRPGVVRVVIEVARERGWDPSAGGPEPFRMTDADALVPIDGGRVA